MIHSTKEKQEKNQRKRRRNLSIPFVSICSMGTADSFCFAYLFVNIPYGIVFFSPFPKRERISHSSSFVVLCLHKTKSFNKALAAALAAAAEALLIIIICECEKWRASEHFWMKYWSPSRSGMAWLSAWAPN